MTKPFSLAFQQKMVTRLTGKDAVSVRQLAVRTGLRQQTLALIAGGEYAFRHAGEAVQARLVVEEKTRILAKASTLTGAELTDFLQCEGVRRAEYEQWRLALDEEGRASVATVKRIRARARTRSEREDRARGGGSKTTRCFRRSARVSAACAIAIRRLSTRRGAKPAAFCFINTANGSPKGSGRRRARRHRRAAS